MSPIATGETAVHRGRTAFVPTSQYGRTGEGLSAIAKALVHRRIDIIYSISPPHVFVFMWADSAL